VIAMDVGNKKVIDPLEWHIRPRGLARLPQNFSVHVRAVDSKAKSIVHEQERARIVKFRKGVTNAENEHRKA